MNSEVESIKIDEKTLSVYGSIEKENVDDKIVYDHVIFASEVGAVQSIFNKTMQIYENSKIIKNVLDNCNNSFIGKMRIAPDYKVVRVFFDKQLNSSAPDILETPDFSPINLVAQYHLLEEEFSIWAKKTGGSVIEFHCYTWSKYFDSNVTDDQVWKLISPTVNLIYPEIFERNFQVLAYHVNSYKNFASFELGLNSNRPFVDSLVKTNLNNIYLTGDWVRTPFPSALMERAVSTGRLAANQILLNDHVRQSSLLVVNSKGPGL